MTSCPALSGKARKFGRKYRRMAIVKVSGEFEGTPSMISVRARGVLEIVRDEVHSVGTSLKSYGFRRLQELKDEADALNSSLAS